VSQVLAGALLFPVIFRSLSETLLLAAASWPFLQLAGFLSSSTTQAIILCECYISMWLAILGLWRVALISSKARMTATAIAAAMCLAGPLLWYLRNEFAGEPTPMQMTVWSCASPVMGTIGILHAGQAITCVFATIIGLLLASAIAAIWLRKHHRA
jgi:hypothetical protein